VRVIWQKNRKFLYEGQLDLNLIKEGKKKRNRYFFLFSDILLQCKVKRAQNIAKKFALQTVLHLSDILSITKNPNQPHSLIISCKNEEWELISRNQKHCDLWFDKIQSAYLNK